MSSVFVTSHLVVGDMPTTISGQITPVQTPEEAVQVIEQGGTAVLPEGTWDLAEQVLVALGADEEHARRQVQQSHSPDGGEIPVAPQ